MKIKLPARKSDAHKGDFGHVLIIGGDYGMGGAAIMAALAAARSGAGKVTVLTRDCHVSALLTQAPNIMYILEKNIGKKIFKNKTAIVIGCGLGKSTWSRRLLKLVLDSDLPKIIDADALNLISESRKKIILKNAVITPHVGEAARLLGLSSKEIQDNREASVKKLYEKFGAATVLKGYGTLVFSGEKIYKCKNGNPAMAVAGMGDVLSGIIGATLAQGVTFEESAVFGVEVHAQAGDLTAQEQGEIGMSPCDLIGNILRVMNKKGV